LTRRRVYHINKEGFLPAFKDAFFDVFTKDNCCTVFEALGLVPLNAQVVLDCLEVWLRTPPEPPPEATSWQSKTPSNTLEFGSQLKLVRDSFARSPTTAQAGFSQLIKGAELMLHQNTLLTAHIHEVEEQLAVITKRKARKQKRIQHGGTLEYGDAADQVAASTALVVNPSKRTCSSGPAEGVQPAQRHCGNCGQTGHNARTCQRDAAESSASEASTQYILSSSSSSDNDDPAWWVACAKHFCRFCWFVGFSGALRYLLLHK
jgi:hypothetical protein